MSTSVQKIFRAVPNLGLRSVKNQDVKQFFEFTTETTIERALTEFSARVCYNSVKRLGSAPNFIEGILKSGHLSTAEHASLMLPLRVFNGDVPPRLEMAKINRFFDFPDRFIAGNLRSWLEVMAAGSYSGIFEYIVAVFPDVFPSGSYVNEVEMYEFAEQAAINVECFEPEGGTPNVYLLAVNRGELDVSRRTYTILKKPWVRYTWLIEGVSRSLTHQLVRHRGLSFCLAGDTVVPSFGKKFFTMRQLWEYQEQNKNGPLQQLRLRGLDDKRRLVPVKIKRVINSGFQQLYKVKTESGREIRATENHLFLTATNGWKKLKDLEVGEELLANGGTKTVFRDKILSIELNEIEETFDLEIDHECHNFVADGLVVHNSQESQRYVDFSKSGVSKNYPLFVLPESWNDEQKAKMQSAYENVADFYEELRQDGAKKEDARFILPNAASTRLVVSGNLPELLHFFKIRTAKDAQWEIRRLASEMLKQAYLATPVPELRELYDGR